MNESLINNIRLIIIEDEIHNSRMLQRLTEELRPGWQVEAVLESVAESVGWLKSNPAPMLILMDIQLSDGICFSLFEQVEIDPSCKIIFTTAYDEYALRAFKVNSVDYLLKPIEKTELENAFVKFEELISTPANILYDKNVYSNLINSLLKEKKEYRTRFLISGINSWQRLETKDIAYIYSENKLTFAVDYNRKEHMLEFTLEQLEKELDFKIFFRANRKTIISIESIKEIRNDMGGRLQVILQPKPDFEISVSRLKAGEFKKWLGN